MDDAFKANLARKPDGSDRSQAKLDRRRRMRHRARQYLLCRLMLTNEKDPKEKEWGNAIKVIFPTSRPTAQRTSTFRAWRWPRHAPNRDNAVKLMEFLSGHKAQQIYAEKNFEYPVEPGLEPSEIVKSFGTLKADTLPLIDIANNRKAASEMVDRVGLNDGPSS